MLPTGFPGFIARELVRTCRAARVDAFWHVIVLPEQVAGVGAGNVNEAVFEALRDALARGVAVVVASRVPRGGVYSIYGDEGGGVRCSARERCSPTT